MKKHILVGIALLIGAAQASAGDVAATEAWVRATVPGQDSAAVSLRINARKEARLVAVSTPAAERVEIHLMKQENGMMMMRETDAVALPANQEVKIGSGNHLMLVGLKQPLKAGGSILLTLTVEYADKHKEIITVKTEIRPLIASHDMPNMGHDMGGMPRGY